MIISEYIETYVILLHVAYYAIWFSLCWNKH